jgi:hypothetical protein
MKQRHLFIAIGIVAVVLAVCTIPANAQRIVNVPQGIGTLEQTIHGDSLNRKTQPTVYVLARGGYYGTLTSVVNFDHLQIRAAYGTGAMPIVRPALPATGSALRPFAPKGNLTLSNIYVVNKDDHPSAPSIISSSIRPTAAKIRIVVDSCQFENDGQGSIRLDNANNSIFITNTIYCNLGDQNLANGRIVDTRGTNQDTLVIENCIIYNVSEKLVRTGTEGATGLMGYHRINQNTIVNSPNNTMFNFGKVKTGFFTNNLLVNSACIGDTSTPGGMIMADPRTDTPQSLTISNNNWFIDTAITNMYKTIKPPFSLYTPRRRNWFDSTVTRISAPTRSKNDTLAVTFTTGLPVPKALVLAMHDTSLTQTENEKPSLPLAPGSTEFGQVHYALNLTYPTTSPLYTGGTKGQRIGSLLDWKIVMGLGDHGPDAIPTSYSLDQNYPNPFNPTTHISYSISKTAQVRVEVFDILGQSVRLLESARQQPGNYTIVWDGRDRAGRLQSSGVYLYRLHVDGVPMTKKMILMK